MPPTIQDDKANAEPSAPPLSDSIPVVAAYPISNDETFATDASPSLQTASMPPRPPANAAVPPGMMAKTVTTKYADGREVTVTEFVPASNNSPAPAATSATASAATSTPHSTTQSLSRVPPRGDLGSMPVSFTCPYCSHVGPTRTMSNFGMCTWISVIVLLFFCFPFFWVPFWCRNCMDTKHFCRNCGRVVGESSAECCN